jgi:teichuronic acid exporter
MTKKLLVSAMAWGISGQFAKLFLKFGVSILLARMLSPKEFGLVGMVTVIIALLTSFSELGLVTSIIQKKEVTQQELSSVFWVNCILGLFVSILFYLSANLISDFYHEPDLVNVVKVLSLNFFLNSLILTHNALLSKSLNFKRYELYTTISTFVASFGAIALAYLNQGVWALVGLYSFTSIMNFLVVWVFEKWRPSFVLKFSLVRNMLSFGFKVSLSSILNTLVSGLDTIIIGKYFSTVTLGLYSFSQNIINIPTATFSGVFARTLLPVMSRLQEDIHETKKTYKRSINMVNFFFIPAMLSVVVLADPIVRIFLGDKWVLAIPYLRMFAIIAIFYPVSAININVLLAQSRGGEFLKLTVLKKSLLLVALLVGLNWGIMGILYALIVVSVIGLYFNMLVSGKASNYSVKDQIFDLIPISILSIAYTAILWMFFLLFTPFFGQIISSFLSLLFSIALLLGVSKRFAPTVFADFRLVLGV